MPARRPIPKDIQNQVRQRANFLCEYCHASEQWQYVAFTIEHTALRAVTRYSKIYEEKIYQILTTYSGVPHCSGKRCIDAVLEQQPHIFHFIGHGCLKNETGEEVGQIALVDDLFDEALWVDANFFSGLLNRYRPGVVMLQACEGGMLSASQAFVGVASKIVQQNIPVVVAMQYEVSNITASRFAYRFYERLAQDDPVDIAAQNGRRAIALNTQYQKRDFATPVIFMRVNDGYLFQRQETEAESGKLNGQLADKNNAQNIRIVDQYQEVNQQGKYNQNSQNFNQNVKQVGEDNLNAGQASNLSMGDDDY